MALPWLTILIVIPLMGAVACAIAGPRARMLALCVAIFEFATVGHVARLMITGGEMSQRAEMLWRLHLDGLSLPLVVLTALLGVVAVSASWRVEHRPTWHFAALLALEAAVIGVFLADDLLLFYGMWEAVLIPMYFLIGVWGHENRRHAATKFFVYTFAGSALMLVGFLLAALSPGVDIVVTPIPAIAGHVPGAVQPLVLALVLAGMLVKVPAFPLHTWLPDAHVEAPTAGSIMLAGVLLKMGGYGLMRVAVPLAPHAFAAWGRPLLAGLGIIGIVYGALMALAQTDLKRLVAYSSVAHMGFVLLAVAAATRLAYQAAVLVMVSHGLVAALLFWLVGALYERTHTREIARLGGFGRTTPAWAGVFTFAALASLGLPGLSGFPGEALTVFEGYRAWGGWIALVAVGVVLAGAYNLMAVRRVAHGKQRPEWSSAHDLTRAEVVTASLLIAPIVALGLWPALVTAVSDPALVSVLSGVRR